MGRIDFMTKMERVSKINEFASNLVKIGYLFTKISCFKHFQSGANDTHAQCQFTETSIGVRRIDVVRQWLSRLA